MKKSKSQASCDEPENGPRSLLGTLRNGPVSFRTSFRTSFRPSFRRTRTDDLTQPAGFAAERRARRSEPSLRRRTEPNVTKTTTVQRRAPVLSRLLQPFFRPMSTMSPSPHSSSSYNLSTRAAAARRESPWNSNHSGSGVVGGACGDTLSPTCTLSSDGSVEASVKLFAVYRITEMLRRNQTGGRDQRNGDVAYFEDDFVTFACESSAGFPNSRKTVRGQSMRNFVSRVVSKF